jgi:hypothetical protein
MSIDAVLFDWSTTTSDLPPRQSDLLRNSSALWLPPSEGLLRLNTELTRLAERQEFILCFDVTKNREGAASTVGDRPD